MLLKGKMDKTSRATLPQQRVMASASTDYPDSSDRAEGHQKSAADRKLSASSRLFRSEAVCGDDDTRLSTHKIEKQGSSKASSMGSSLSRGMLYSF